MKTTQAITANIYPTVAKMAMDQISDYPGQGKASHAIVSNGKIVAACSKDYGLLKNEDFFGAFEQQLKAEGISFEAKYRNTRDCQFSADYVLEGTMNIGKGWSRDVLQPQIRLIGSYDGSSPSAGFVGFFREVCKNGLHALKFEVDFKVRHTSNGMALTIPKIQSMMDRYTKKEGVEVIRRFEVLAECVVANPEEMVRNIVTGMDLFTFDKSRDNKTPGINGQFVLDKIKHEVNLLSVVPNKWIVYNALNEWLNEDTRNKKSDAQRTAIDSRLFTAVEYA